MILSQLNLEELATEAGRRDFTKWWSLCLLRGLGLPTLDAVLIESALPEARAEELFSEFATITGAHSLLVRSDLAREHKTYARGGITYPLKEAWLATKRFLDIGRTAIILEPTNRYSNKTSINIIVSRDGDWTAEGLGCGFDTSDLQRDFVTPQWTWSGNYADKRIGRANILNNSTHEIRKRQRLESICHLLGWNDLRIAENFLLETGNDCLFTETVNPPDILAKRLVRDSLIVSESLKSSDFPFTLSFAELWNGRIVYWDITPGQQKWSS